jgi:NAD+ kinase
MRVLVVVNKEAPNAEDASLMLAAYFISQGIDYALVNSRDIPTPEALSANATEALRNLKIASEYDLLIVLGGDGTILRASRLAHVLDAPVFGINYGHLGFLANSNEDGVVTLVAAALAGDVSEEMRTNLNVEVICAGDEEIETQPLEPRTFFALNEVTIGRGDSPQMLSATVEISGDEICTLRGDGVIVSSPTGSTAYALSAGGPLVAPESRAMVIVPLATHTLQSRSIVTQGSDVVEVHFGKEENLRPKLELDGTTLCLDAPIERVIVSCGAKPTRMLYYKKESFYSRVSRVFF